MSRPKNIIITKGEVQMNTRRMHSVIAILALIITAAAAYAHNGVEHVMGTITAITDSSITVDTVKHPAVTVFNDPTTKFTKNHNQSSRNDVKVGLRVVIDAKE